MDITFVTNANSDKEAMSLLSELGLPFRKPDDKPKKAEVKEIIKEPEVEETVTEEPVAEETVTAEESEVNEESSKEEEVSNKDNISKKRNKK